jgi:hypothetical protein
MKEPHVIHPCAVYTVDSLRSVLGLTKTTIGREVRLGRLRVTKRAGKYYLLGRWVLQWLKDGEHHRKQEGDTRAETSA